MTQMFIVVLAYIQADPFISSLVVLPIAVILNILLGWALADFKGSYDKDKLTLGIKKGMVIYLAIGVFSLLSLLITFADIDLRGEMSVAVFTVAGAYLAQALLKLWYLLGYKKPEETQGGMVAPEVVE